MACSNMRRSVRLGVLASHVLGLMVASACATTPPAPPTSGTGTGTGTGGTRESGSGTADAHAGSVTMEEFVGRMIIFITPVNGRADEEFCALNRTITNGMDRSIIEGRSSAAAGWQRWAKQERTEIVRWLGGRSELVSDVSVWVRQPCGDVNDVAKGDMPADTARHHLMRYPASRLYEGMADAYADELIEPRGLAPLARVWFYAGSPDNDQSTDSELGFKGKGVEQARAKFDRDYVTMLNGGRRPLMGPGTRGSLGLDKSTPHGEGSGTLAIARAQDGPVMYEPLGERGNPWIAEPGWLGLILEDTFWERLGGASKGAQPEDVAGPIARFISKPMNFTPREKWQRFCAMVQGRAYTGTGFRGARASDEGDVQEYRPVVALYFLWDAENGLLRGYNDWRVESKGLRPVPEGYFNDAASVLAAVNEFDGPYEEQDARTGVKRRDAAKEAAREREGGPR